MVTNITGVRQHPLQSESKAFNKFVDKQESACPDLESGKITGKDFNRRYKNSFDTYLIELGIMDGPGRRH